MYVLPSGNVPTTTPGDVSTKLSNDPEHLYVGSREYQSLPRKNALDKYKGSSHLEHTATAHPKKDDTSLQHSLARTFFIAQCFGLFPLQGIFGDSVSSLHFSWKSFRTLNSCFAFLGISAMLVVNGVLASKSEFNLAKTGGLAFFCCAMATIVLFFKLAYQWRPLAEQWARVEFEMGPPPGPPLKKTINRTTAILLSLSLLEHLLSIGNVVEYVRKCSNIEDPLEAYFTQYFSPIFYFTEFSLWKAFLLKYFQLVATFAWCFTDLFIMIISVALTQRFKQINYKLNAVRGKVMLDDYWGSAREEFVRLTELLTAVDDVIGHMIILSLANNLWFICAQLHRSLRRTYRDHVQAVYVWYSFLFLFIRTVAMCLNMVQIHEESRSPLNVLKNVPLSGYNTEVRRYIDHVTTEVIGLTGMKFFTITRGVILSVASTIVTYELVLMQMDYGEEVLSMDICHSEYI